MYQALYLGSELFYLKALLGGTLYVAMRLPQNAPKPRGNLRWLAPVGLWVPGVVGCGFG